MSYESRAYDNEHGDPVVVLVATGTHDVSRLISLFSSGNPTCEQVDLGQRVLRQVKRHNAGRAALTLLRDHGGPDFTEPPAATVREWGVYDIADDPNDPDSDGGVDIADSEEEARRDAASWAGGAVCWREVTYGPWRTHDV